MQVACQVRSSVTLHSPFIEGIGFLTLSIDSTVVQRLLLKVLIFLQNLSRALVLRLRATNEFPDLNQLPLAVVPQNVEVCEERLHNAPVVYLTEGIGMKLTPKVRLTLGYFVPVGLSFLEMSSQLGQSP